MRIVSSKSKKSKVAISKKTRYLVKMTVSKKTQSKGRASRRETERDKPRSLPKKNAADLQTQINEITKGGRVKRTRLGTLPT